jgi:hypothetical protein
MNTKRTGLGKGLSALLENPATDITTKKKRRKRKYRWPNRRTATFAN